MVNAQANVREAFRSLYLMLTLGVRRWHDPSESENPYYAFLHRPVAYREETLASVEALLRKLYPGLHPAA